MIQSEVVTWDCTTEGPPVPETWTQFRDPSMKVCGGTPNVIATHDGKRYRHTPNGMLWVAVTDPLAEGPIQQARHQ